MKKFFLKLMTEDVKVEDFTTSEIVLWGCVVPVVFMLIVGFTGWLSI